MFRSASFESNRAHSPFVSFRGFSSWLYVAWFLFGLRYRKTMLGPVWLLVGPALFIFVVGNLFSHVGQIKPSVFIPYLTVGLIVWSLLSGFVVGSTNVFQRNRAQIMQGGMELTALVMVEVSTVVLQFVLQAILIVAVLLFFRASISLYGLVSLIGLALVVANGVWLTVVFGILGARYRDLAEVVQAAMRIAFLATPIIWMPGVGGRAGILDVYLTFNPFYHFLELVRAPLLGNAIAPLSWIVVLCITAVGLLLAKLTYARYARRVALWV